MLLIDAGNTRIKWARQKPGQAAGAWLTCGSAPHAQIASLGAQWQPHHIQDCLISNVAGEAVAAQLEQQLIAAGVPASGIRWFLSKPEQAGVRNSYRQPERLGSDRFASLIGAHHLFPHTALLVATCGTATTIDALDETGYFRGGMILPGLATMARSLAHHTAALPAVTEVHYADVFADNTQDAIISGCINAHIGAICRAADSLRSEDPLCVLSGGGAALIAPHLPVRHQQVDNLVLIGLDVSTREPA